MLAAIQPGDAIMVKGSLGSRMGPIVKTLQSRYRREAAGVPIPEFVSPRSIL